MKAEYPEDRKRHRNPEHDGSEQRDLDQRGPDEPDPGEPLVFDERGAERSVDAGQFAIKEDVPLEFGTREPDLERAVQRLPPGRPDVDDRDCE
uniref:hypothetical protein n=1 Tax=Natronococcus amylolyticus TaxID=44470 RepID=UPI001F4C6DC0|nr:hypothetical protein [Natronococcus amylolyticus]